MHVIDPIPVTLDKPRSILLTLPALKTIEDTLAKLRGEKRVNLFQVFSAGDFGAQELLVILWAGLRHEDPKLTLEQVLAAIARVNMQDIAELVRTAIEQHIKGPTPAAEAAPEPSGDAPLA